MVIWHVCFQNLVLHIVKMLLQILHKVVFAWLLILELGARWKGNFLIPEKLLLVGALLSLIALSLTPTAHGQHIYLIESLVYFGRALGYSRDWHVQFYRWVCFHVLRLAEDGLLRRVSVAAEVPRFGWHYGLVFVFSLFLYRKDGSGHLLLRDCDLGGKVTNLVLTDFLLEFNERILSVVIARVEVW